MSDQTGTDSHIRTTGSEQRGRNAALDETVEQSFPASDSPSTNPNPDRGKTRVPYFPRVHFMNVQHYRQRLLDLERTLSARTRPSRRRGRGEFLDIARDVGDASVADEVASEPFTEAEQGSAILQQVRDALSRVNAGTFGTCIVDGGPIEEKRLDAVAWTSYCLKHEQLRDGATPSSTPTL
jgi:RNA polymerase-binding transcription factor DksA